MRTYAMLLETRMKFNSTVTRIRVTEVIKLMKCCFLVPTTKHKKMAFYNIQNSYVHVQTRKSTIGNNSREVRIMGPNGMDTGSVYRSFIWDSKEAAKVSINRDGYYLTTKRKKWLLHEWDSNTFCRVKEALYQDILTTRLQDLLL